MEMKKCSKCGDLVRLDGYSKQGPRLKAQCKRCDAEYQKKLRTEHPEKARQYDIQERESTKADPVRLTRKRKKRQENKKKNRHPEKRAIEHKRWRANNMDHVRAYKKEYESKHHAATRAQKNNSNNRRRARKKNYYTTAKMVEARWEYYGGICYICGNPAEAIDHVKPLVQGGAHLPCNLRPICDSCNSIKSGKWFGVVDTLKYIGELGESQKTRRLMEVT
jgi:hypothetical protein